MSIYSRAWKDKR